MITGSYGTSMFSFAKHCQIIFQSSCTILHLLQQLKRFPVASTSSKFGVDSVVDFCFSHRSVVASQFAFFWWHMMSNIFSNVYFPSIYYLWWGVCSWLLLIFNLVVKMFSRNRLINDVVLFLLPLVLPCNKFDLLWHIRKASRLLQILEQQ